MAKPSALPAASPCIVPSVLIFGGSKSVVGGRSLTHCATANVQRSENGQPRGRSIISGTVPAIVVNRAPRAAPNLGRASNRPRVYGCAMLANTSWVGPLSTTLPPYITIMRAAFWAITPRSCEIKIRAMPRSCTRSLMRSSIWPRRVTSSAVVGSSAISKSGPQASAMAIVMRWRWPPENWCG